ncbi:MAG: type I DNA topoisomerase [Chloroflexi bacterium]|nr:type I DNA topoisomerase [Chloroflexota bacterium]
MTDNSIVAYCVKCKTKRKMQEPQPVYTERGQPATRGRCPVCGTTMFRMGETPAHAGLPKPDPPPKDGKLVIVESPAKARTVGRFLGKPYRVRASIGHVRDLLRSRLSVDVENDFEPSYRVPNEKKEVVKELQEEVRQAGEVYLATDPDREGEAIAWHLMEAAKISKNQARRVVFHEITRDAIDEAFSHPGDINMKLVNAQQARRILDRLVGYKISPLLWENVRNRTSAGRVQSVALRLIVEREREIEAFVPVEYWSIDAELAKREKKRRSFTATLHRIRGEEVDLKSEEDTQKIVDELEVATYVVTEVRKGQRQRNPSPPYTTSTMQQEASRRLGFTANRTMRIAQQLYEGVEIGEEGSVGLITYMRTDSVNVAEAAQEEARAYIAEKYGANYRPAEPRHYKTKAKGAQEAHEAIRPTSVRREPKAIKKYLTRDQYRLYDLIWKRFLASQMSSAILDTISVDVVADSRLQIADSELTAIPSHQLSAIGHKPDYLFRATGSSIRFPGFLILYEEAKDEDAAPEEGEGKILPPLSEGEILDLLRLLPEQHFTKPPPRYSEASLVKTLEEYGIGRPSTYAPIISIIQTRGYVEREDRRLVPTEIGFIVNDLLVKHFPDIINVDFTARMEEDLDLIASGEREWVPVLREFYDPFEKAVKRAERTMENVDLGEQLTGEMCEKCGHPMIVKFGRYGKFIACSNFPECRNTKSYQIKTGVACPECGSDLVEKRTRRGRTFYGCSRYPECEFATWNQPLPQLCPNCGGLLTVAGKDKARCIKCEEVVDLAPLEGTD